MLNFKRLKKLLYDYKLLSTTNTIGKINYLLTCDISLYDNPYKHTEHLFVSDDIVKYRDELLEIANSSLYTENIAVKDITIDNSTTISFRKWCSEKGGVVREENEVLKGWLKAVKFFLLKTRLLYYKSASNTPTHAYNAARLLPYYRNTNDLVDIIYKLSKELDN